MCEYDGTIIVIAFVAITIFFGSGYYLFKFFCDKVKTNLGISQSSDPEEDISEV